MTFYLLALIPLLFPIGAKVFLHSSISYLEWIIQTVIGLVVVFGLYSYGRYAQIQDYEIWNGSVTKKEAVRESCPIGWVDSTDNFCRHYRTRRVKTGTQTCTGTGKDRRCSDDYKTQYNYTYSWEQNWMVRSNIKQSWEIERVDRQGADTPLRWAAIQIGDPVSKTNSYENYVKAASNSLFNKDKRMAEQYAEQIPEYPLDIYDYYRVDRVITSPKFVLNNAETYNKLLPEILKVLGPERQANVVILVTDITDPAYGDAVIYSWQGAKKNDIVLIVGVDNGSDLGVKWLKVHSWSKDKMFNVVMRDEILNRGDIQDPVWLMDTIKAVTLAHFERQSMKEFEYLKDEIEPSEGMIIFIVIFTLILSGGLTFLFHRVDIGGR